jgi:hypothetical protein
VSDSYFHSMELHCARYCWWLGIEVACDNLTPICPDFEYFTVLKYKQNNLAVKRIYSPQNNWHMGLIIQRKTHAMTGRWKEIMLKYCFVQISLKSSNCLCHLGEFMASILGLSKFSLVTVDQRLKFIYFFITWFCWSFTQKKICYNSIYYK